MAQYARKLHYSPTGIVLSLGNDLRRPGPLGEEVLIFKEPTETIIVNSATDLKPATAVTRQAVKQFCTDFEGLMFSEGGITPQLLTCVSMGFELVMLRIDASANAQMSQVPDHADTLLIPAVASIFKSEQLLRNEDPALLRDENLDHVRLAQELVEGHQAMLDAIDPLHWGSTARKVQAQQVLYDFCKRVGNNGKSAIDRNRILTLAMTPLRILLGQAAGTAQETKQVIAQVSHQVEAATLARVKEVLDAQAASTLAVPPSSTGTGGLTGAHAPGQKPVPPGAMPVVPVHPKPKRRGASSGRPPTLPK